MFVQVRNARGFGNSRLSVVYRGNAFTYQSPCLAIVLDDHGTTVAALVLLHQLLRHLVSILDIVTAASPLELVVFTDGEGLIGKVVVCRRVIVSRVR